MERTAIATWHVECYDAFIANRGENGLVRPDRSQILDQIIGTGRGSQTAEDDEAAHSEL
jgi:hypothetical protein